MSDISLCPEHLRGCGELQYSCRRALDKPGEIQSYLVPDCWRGAECGHHLPRPTVQDYFDEAESMASELRKDRG